MNTLQTLQLILSIMNTAAGIAMPLVAGNPEAANAEHIAAGLLSIATSAATAYQQHTGQPIDLGELKPIDPVE